MSTYITSLLNSTTSRYTSLKRSLLADESDGPTEDDTHISRVLRAYYTEKGRVFPPWLPPDPNQAPAPSAYSRPGMMGRRTDGPPQPMHSTGSGGGGGLLSDLWGGSDRTEEAPPAPVSLRRGAVPPRPGARPGGGESYQSSGQGSYQQSYSGRHADNSTPPPGTTSAQERLKARLMGARGGAQPSGPGTQARPGLDRGASDNSVGSSSSGRGGGGGAYGGSQRPYVSASAPWDSGDHTAGGGGSGYGEPVRRTGGRAPTAGGGRYG